MSDSTFIFISANPLSTAGARARSRRRRGGCPLILFFLHLAPLHSTFFSFFFLFASFSTGQASEDARSQVLPRCRTQPPLSAGSHDPQRPWRLWLRDLQPLPVHHPPLQQRRDVCRPHVPPRLLDYHSIGGARPHGAPLLDAVFAIPRLPRRPRISLHLHGRRYSRQRGRRLGRGHLPLGAWRFKYRCHVCPQGLERRPDAAEKEGEGEKVGVG